MAALCKVCDDLDIIERELETPVINQALKGRAVQHKEVDLQVLVKPARRETEVLVYPGDGSWYSQNRVLLVQAKGLGS
jgi:hypothetical protein